MMLWGMTLQPGYEYTEVVNDEVRLSMASLECRPTKGGSLELSSYVVLKTTRGEFLLCTLEKGPMPQQHLDLVLQPRERVTFSVEGSGVVHLMGYTSELPEDQQAEEEEPSETEPLPEEAPYMEDKDMENEHEQQQRQQDDHGITIKEEEPESVVIPILEEALDDMNQDEQAPALSAGGDQTSLQGNVGQSFPAAQNYDYQGVDQGWMDQPQTAQSSNKVQNPSSRADATPVYAPNQGRGTVPGGVQQGPGYLPVRGMPAPNAPSTSFAQQAAERLQGAVPPPTDVKREVTGTSARFDIPQLVAQSPRRRSKPDVRRLPPGQRASFRQNVSPRRPPAANKVYRCHECNMDFCDRSMYLVHQTRHTGKSCFHCEYCMKPFASRGLLNRHERSHTGEKPHACRFCGKGFADVGNMRKHERTHDRKK